MTAKEHENSLVAKENDNTPVAKESDNILMVKNDADGTETVVDRSDPKVEQEAQKYLDAQLAITKRARARYEEHKDRLPVDAKGKWVVFFQDDRPPVIADTQMEALQNVREPCYCTQHGSPPIPILMTDSSVNTSK